MRDVIVVGCGGGGPVLANELARWGLDVLVLESGPRFLRPEQEWSRLEDDANNPLTGYLRSGPGDRAKAAWTREEPADEFVWQVAGVGGTTLHYFGNSPRAAAGVFAGYAGPDAGNYDVAHRFPFSLAELRPYYRWVEATLPVQTAAIGRKEEVFLGAAERMGLRAVHDEGAVGAVVPAAGERRPPARRHRRAGARPAVPGRHRLHALRPLLPGLRGAAGSAAQPQGQAVDGQLLRADDAHRGRVGRGRAARDAAHRRPRRPRAHRRLGQRAAGERRDVPRRGRREQREDARVVVLAAGTVETPRLWFNSNLPNPNGWVGRGLTDHHLDMVTGVFDSETGSSKGAGSSARIDYPGYGGIENICLPPALQAYAFTYSDSGTAGAYRTASPATDAGADVRGRLVAGAAGGGAGRRRPGADRARHHRRRRPAAERRHAVATSCRTTAPGGRRGSSCRGGSAPRARGGTASSSRRARWSSCARRARGSCTARTGRR